MTRTPRDANCSERAKPIPEFAPVIRAVKGVEGVDVFALAASLDKSERLLSINVDSSDS